MEKFRIVIASLPDRKRLVAEILYEGIQWAEISQENDHELTLQLYPHPREKLWGFPYDDALQILERAKNKLLAL